MRSRRPTLLSVVIASSLAVLANLFGGAAADAGGSRATSYTTPLQVAFVSANRGVGLFETPASNGSGSGRCVLYTRPTNDGGSSFERRSAPLFRYGCATSYPLSQLVFDQNGDLFEYGPRLRVSRNRGRSWTSPRLSGSVLDVVVGEGRAWALTTRCRLAHQWLCELTLLESTDRGVHWRVYGTQPPRRTIEAWDVPGSGLWPHDLLAATDPGDLVLAFPRPSSSPTKPGPAVATVERIAPSTGRWTTASVPCIGQSDLSAAADNSLWLACAGEPGAGQQLKSLAISRDGGRSWSVVSRGCTPPSCHEALPTDGYLGGLVALSARTAFYVGARSNLLATRDGGAHWHAFQQIGGDASGTTDVTFVNQRDGWVLTLGSGAGLWRTRDGGITWKRD